MRSINFVHEAQQIIPRFPEPQIHNIALGERSMTIHTSTPAYRDFGTDDVRHSLADIRKTTIQVGYVPTKRIAQGLISVMPWYVTQEKVNGYES
jgi:nucleoside-diphosphate-sugar epimerase